MISFERVPTTGDIVRVRTRLHIVEDVQPAAQTGDGNVVRLRCIDDDALQSQDVVVWECEPDAAIVEGHDWTAPAGAFDRPDTFAAFVRTQRWQAIHADKPNLLQAPFRAGIQIKWYQLEPLLRALALPRVTLFIADDVGLGKTIEAGLIVRELLHRQRLRRVVVAAPAGVCEQWREEMEDKFGLSFQIFDADWVETCRRRHGYHINPWRLHNRFIISHERLRMESYAQQLEDWFDKTGESGMASMLILDEAHHAAPVSDARGGDAANLLQTVRRIAPKFEHRLFLSATPHNGYFNSFTTLLHLLDDRRFLPGETPNKEEFARVFIRRLKVDLRELNDADEPLPRRVPIRCDLNVPKTAPEHVLPDLIQEYNQSRIDQAVATTAKGDVRNLVGMVGKVLMKRMLSSVRAFESTLATHVANLDGKSDLDEEWTDDEEGEASRDAKKARLGTRKLSTQLPLSAEQRAMIQNMAGIAASARTRNDPKVDYLLEWLNGNLCPGLLSSTAGNRAHWNNRRVIIFTEYIDTLRMVREQLEAKVCATDRGRERIVELTGESGKIEKRMQIRDWFNADPAENPVRILLCTDAAREGINLQHHCADLFHLDLPWNPARLEQRNGRIDRFGQPSADVRCHYFQFAGRSIDDILRRIVKKAEQISGDDVDLAPLIDRDVAATMSKAVFRYTTADLEKELDEIDKKLPPKHRKAIEESIRAARARGEELAGSKKRLNKAVAESRDLLGHRPDSLWQTIDAALKLLRYPTLEPDWPTGGRAFRFPQLDRQGPASIEWQPSIDALRPKRKPGEDEQIWHSHEPRPVVFEARRDRADVVQLHLEHPVVRRLIGRFYAQGFQTHELKRACVLRSGREEPIVALLARLTLYSKQGSRLHDEIVSVVAGWIEPIGRRGGLKVLAKDGKVEALRLDDLDRALGSAEPVSARVQEGLLQYATRDICELKPHLLRRVDDAMDEAREALVGVADHQAKVSEDMLRDQLRRLDVLLHDAETKNPALLDLMDGAPLDANRKLWLQRKAEIETNELEAVPARVRASMTVAQHRVRQVGLIYLWPTAG